MLWPGVVKGGLVGGRMTLLIGASLDEGALVYEFRFKEVVGLAGASAVAVSPAGDFVYVASEDDKAIAVFALGQQYDVMSRNTTMFHQIQVCWDSLPIALAPCLSSIGEIRAVLPGPLFLLSSERVLQSTDAGISLWCRCCPRIRSKEVI